MAKPFKLDAVTAEAVDLAREAAVEEGGDEAVGAHLGVVAEEGDRIVTHSFECLLTGYADWRWAVTLVRASRSKVVTVNEVVLLPQPAALLAPDWVPWEERIGAGDISPGMLMATPDNDPRLEPGFAATDLPADADPSEWVQLRTTVAELGLGRQRVLSRVGRDEAVERWCRGEAGPHNEMSREAPANCATCAYFVPLRGSLGVIFGACTNEYSPSDGHVVSLDHGCGGHSDVVAEQRPKELPAPAFDTVNVEESLFD
ncbi:DUF3027 domain-containing protein [Tessaracoccus sp. MC1865]|uniref:DUF3027 domain-containing protein n=1 Tax=Tessaracoccus sp. MC1865 TaxID=2760310 RepID=UPI0016026900|nr:DUF3027 domain-containing protein [Tessaracoccus sp. MC1865]MBB1482527.1 DUF3027 domain-containing protein [Tessaracoccus sp. MC1865]QTO38019.1 DUF3027 domain-containing protein [Tessaracoccus sp. MC1865]